ncbi:excisionase family DNA binding protein [Pseudoxanthomonas japonensis]|uniref:helix-turn-helix domain-containing protein n=1 Tax=Pseudoxanthomonas japonensis TaxID=69284 RepID=UPI0028555345|nr:helix-turn-helix domain-containing protein [Pseudoxanthomonas japonensis]MDR7070525.1 excisionase family DNA binding protein [Pseudoxanthomonas japonensis]
MNSYSNSSAPLAHTVPEACRRLGISRTTIYQLIANGGLRSFKIGARTLIPEEDLHNFIAKQLAQSQEGKA